MSVVPWSRLLGSLQAVLKAAVSQRSRRPGESWLTTAMAVQLARARRELEQGRAQGVVNDVGLLRPAGHAACRDRGHPRLGL